MNILLLISLLIPLVLIGYVISGLDEFLERGGILDEEIPSYPTAILLGKSDLAKQVNVLLKQNNIQVIHLAEPFLLERGQNLHYLFALSENDADNIALCKIGEKVYGIKNMISICNDQNNEKMFIHEHIRYLSGKDAAPQILLQSVTQEKEQIS